MHTSKDKMFQWWPVESDMYQLISLSRETLHASLEVMSLVYLNNGRVSWYTEQKHVSQAYHRMNSWNYLWKRDVLNTRKSGRLQWEHLFWLFFYVSLMKRINLKYIHCHCLLLLLPGKEPVSLNKCIWFRLKTLHSVGQHSKSSAKIGDIHVGNKDTLSVPIFIIHCVIIKKWILPSTLLIRHS